MQRSYKVNLATSLGVCPSRMSSTVTSSTRGKDPQHPCYRGSQVSPPRVPGNTVPGTREGRNPYKDRFICIFIRDYQIEVSLIGA